jgi:hypothetical protein
MFEMFNNVVGVETGLDIRGIVVRLSTRARPALEPIQLPIRWTQGREANTRPT